MLKVLKRNQIDESKWNSVVNNSSLSLPYLYSWYLDAVCENWRGVVLNDYEAIMPLPISKKFLVKYIYQPFFCQQLGVVSNSEKPTFIEPFIELIRKEYLLSFINFNYQNQCKEFILERRKNLILPLNKSLADIQKKYSDNLRRNLRKADKLSLRFSEQKPADFETFYLQHTASKDDNFKTKNEPVLFNLIQAIEAHGKARYFSVHKEESLLATCLIVKENNRLIYLMPACSHLGREFSAMHWLINQIIEFHADQDLILDFEGSSVDSIAKFYESFGAEKEVYCTFSHRKF